MAAYPSIGMRVSVQPAAARRVDISDGGTVRAVNLNEVTPYRIRVDHPLISSTEKGTLESFYSANGNTTNTITIDGDVFNVIFESDYQFDSVSSAYWNGSVTLIGNKQ